MPPDCSTHIICWRRLPSIVRCKPTTGGRRTAAYSLLRFEEDRSFLEDPTERKDWLDPIKYIPLGDKSGSSYLSIGCEVRGVYEQQTGSDGGGSLNDGVYNVGGGLIVPSGRSNARFVGNRPGIQAGW
jgi:hypothetical protein